MTLQVMKHFCLALLSLLAFHVSNAQLFTNEWYGTGFALKNNYIVTNYHVIEGANTIDVRGVNRNFRNKYKASVVAIDKVNDLAILKVEGGTVLTDDIPYSVKTSASDVGEDVFVLGYPLTATMGEEVKLTTGVVSSKTGFQGDLSLYQISAPIQPGNSGGPLFDDNGNLIGVVSSKHSNAENVGYAIKASYLKNLVESVITDDVLPKINKISFLPRVDKIKRLSPFVYLIECSNKSASSISYPSVDVKIEPSTLTLYENETYQLSLSPKGHGSVERWESENASVVSVNSTGMVMARRSGSARIWVYLNDGTLKYCKITIKSRYGSASTRAGAVNNSSLDYSSYNGTASRPVLKPSWITLSVGEERQLNVEPRIIKINRWESENIRIVEVSNSGTVIAKAKGKTKVSAYYGDQKLECIVTVR